MTIHQPPTQSRTLGPEFAGLADDTEESILGSSLHLAEQQRRLAERDQRLAALEAELRRLRGE